jgi:hypothetical protein
MLTSFAMSEGRLEIDDFPSRALCLTAAATIGCSTLNSGKASGLASQSGSITHQKYDSLRSLRQIQLTSPAARFHARLWLPAMGASQELDKAVAKLGVRVLRTPVRAPTANAFCERLGGSLRRECLDFLIPLNERHLRMIVKEWGIHYNRGRPHSSLGPGIPQPSQERVPASDHRHKLPAGYRVGKTPVLGGLHHEYHLVKEAA